MMPAPSVLSDISARKAKLCMCGPKKIGLSQKAGSRMLCPPQETKPSH
jgi:hypothetical protein